MNAGQQPEIGAIRHTRYAQAALQPCGSCGRPGWSVDGSANVVKHEDDADDGRCPAAQRHAADVARWLVGYEAIAGKVEAAIGAAEPPSEWAEKPDNPPGLYDNLVTMFDKIKNEPYRLSRHVGLSTVHLEARRVIDGDELDAAPDGGEYLRTITGQLAKDVADRFNAHLAEVAPLLRGGYLLCVHEMNFMIEYGITSAHDREDRVRARQRVHLVPPGQECMAEPARRAQYGLPADTAGASPTSPA